MESRIRRQKRLLLLESAIIVAVMLALVILVAVQLFGGLGILVVVLGVIMLVSVTQGRGNQEIPQNLTPVERQEAPRIYQLLDTLTSRAGLKRSPSVFLLHEELMNAATLETREGPLIVLTPSTVRQLDTRQLTGILAHEIAHLEYRDTILLQLTSIVHSITQSLTNIAWLLLILFFPLFFLAEGSFPFYLLLLLFGAPLASVLLQLAFSRSRELNADLGAVELTDDPEGLAQALEKIDRVQSYTLSMLFPFKRPRQRSSIFRSHPNIPVRVRRLRDIAEEY
jgi:heat shock protein HtpX